VNKAYNPASRDTMKRWKNLRGASAVLGIAMLRGRKRHRAEDHEGEDTDSFWQRGRSA
jgi:hypothetical protein